MSCKRFYVKIDLQLHAITCPGVWLCAHDCLEATIETLGYYLRTGTLEPRFPLLCNDYFVMEGYFKTATNIEQLKLSITAEPLNIYLWQNGNVLAYFNGTINDILTRSARHSTAATICDHNLNAQLQMKVSTCFPGILSPKIELSAEIFIKDRLSRGGSGFSAKLCQLQNSNKKGLSYPKTMSKLKKTQQTVCHARGSQCSASGNTYCDSENNSNTGLIYSVANEDTVDYNALLASASGSCVCENFYTNDDESTVEHQKTCSICQSYINVFLSME